MTILKLKLRTTERFEVKPDGWDSGTWFHTLADARKDAKRWAKESELKVNVFHDGELVKA